MAAFGPVFCSVLHRTRTIRSLHRSRGQPGLQPPVGVGMWHIGVDAHKKRCSLTAKDEQGRLVARRVFPHTRDGWADALRDAPPGSRVAIECVGWYQPVCDHVEGLGLVPILVHAKNVALIAKSKKKTDRYDSEMLCDLLRSGFLPTAHIPRKATRELRELTRHLDDLVKQQTAAKNRIQRLLERCWIEPIQATDLFGKKGRAWLDELELAPAYNVVLKACLAEIDTLGGIRETMEHEIAKRVQDDEDVDLLLGIDGLSIIGAATLKAEIDTATRFQNREKIRSNFGLATSVRDSADTHKRGRITKQGPGVVRKILVQGALHFAAHNANAKAKLERLSKHRGKGIARVATAAGLLDVAYQVLKTRQPYRQARPAKHEEKRAALRRLATQPASLSVS